MKRASIGLTGLVVLAFSVSCAQHDVAIPNGGAANYANSSSSFQYPTADDVRSSRMDASRKRAAYRFTSGSDSSIDICDPVQKSRGWCVVGGQSLNEGAYGWGETRSGTIKVTVSGLPANVTAVASPASVTGPPYSYHIIFNTAAVPKSTPGYSSYTQNVSFVPSGGATPAYTESATSQNYIACSVNSNQCPAAEIVDNRQAANPVVVSGSPPPLQTVVAGKEMDLTTRWKSGTGTGTYTASSTYSPYPTTWTISGGADAVTKYDIASGSGPAVVSNPVATTEPNFYWFRGVDPKNGDVQTVDTLLIRSDQQEYAYPETTVKYLITTPTVSSYIASIHAPALGGPSHPNYVQLGRGTAYGMQFGFTAVAPANGAGYLAGQQDLSNLVQFTPDSTSYNHGTGYAQDLDTCPIYAAATPIAASSSATWKAIDNPETTFDPYRGGTMTEVTRMDYVYDFLMYLPTPVTSPTARKSVWVPLGRINWQWGFDVSRPNITTDWTFKSQPTNYAITQTAGSDAPSTFTGTYAPVARTCASPPPETP